MVKRITFFFLVIIYTSSCSKVEPCERNRTTKEYPLTDVSKLKFGEEVTLEGVYVKSYIYMGLDPGSHQGLYQLRVNDTLSVMLLEPYQEKAVRPQEEVTCFENKKVKVTGFILEETILCPPEDDDELNCNGILRPCFTTIKDIRLVN